VNYIVFSRIDGIKTLPTEDIAAAVDALASVTDRTAAVQRFQSHSSVYGRLSVVPSRATLAMEFATSILNSAAAVGVRVAIGVACGKLESTEDILEHNIAGVAVNRAARLAHLNGGAGRIAVDEEVVQDAKNASQDFRDSFAELETGKVKNSELRYSWLNCEPPEIRPLARGNQTAGSETVHIVVYDIAGYSKLEERLLKSVANLRGAVLKALRVVGVDAPHNAKDRLWYAPAGDGGVVVFRSHETAWAFARTLRAEATGWQSPIRIGITTGTVIVLGGLPVGHGIIEADELSGLPVTGEICASRRFWERTLEPSERRGWVAQAHSSDSEAFLLREDGDSQVGRDDWAEITEALINELAPAAKEIAEIPAYLQTVRKPNPTAGLKAVRHGLSADDARKLGVPANLDKFVELIDGFRDSIIRNLPVQPNRQDVEFAFRLATAKAWNRWGRKSWIILLMLLSIGSFSTCCYGIWHNTPLAAFSGATGVSCFVVASWLLIRK